MNEIALKFTPPVSTASTQGHIFQLFILGLFTYPIKLASQVNWYKLLCIFSITQSIQSFLPIASQLES